MKSLETIYYYFRLYKHSKILIPYLEQIISQFKYITTQISLNHLYRILSSGCSGSKKTDVLLILIKTQGPDIDKIDLYGKDPFQSKYELLISRREKVKIKKLKN